MVELPGTFEERMSVPERRGQWSFTLVFGETYPVAMYFCAGLSCYHYCIPFTVLIFAFKVKELVMLLDESGGHVMTSVAPMFQRLCQLHRVCQSLVLCSSNRRCFHSITLSYQSYNYLSLRQLGDGLIPSRFMFHPLFPLTLESTQI